MNLSEHTEEEDLHQQELLNNIVKSSTIKWVFSVEELFQQALQSCDLKRAAQVSMMGAVLAGIHCAENSESRVVALHLHSGVSPIPRLSDLFRYQSLLVCSAIPIDSQYILKPNTLRASFTSDYSIKHLVLSASHYAPNSSVHYLPGPVEQVSEWSWYRELIEEEHKRLRAAYPEHVDLLISARASLPF